MRELLLFFSTPLVTLIFATAFLIVWSRDQSRYENLGLSIGWLMMTCGFSISILSPAEWGVVALSQRDTCVASNFGQREMDRLANVVCAHYRAVVEKGLAMYDTDDGVGYVYDVFVDRRWAVTVVDVAPWRGGTDALLFSWEELEEAPWMRDENPRAQLRCVSDASGIRPARSMYDAMPVELRDADAGDALADAARRLHDIQLEGAGANDGSDSDSSQTSREDEDEGR